MLKRLFTIALCGLLFETILPAVAWARHPAGPLANPQTARVRIALQRVGTGANSLVAVRLRNQSVASGWVSDVGPEAFELTDPQSGVQARVRFLDVSRLAGANLVSGNTVQYGDGIGAKLSKAISFIVPGR